MALGSVGRTREDKEFSNRHFTWQSTAGAAVPTGPDLAGASLQQTGIVPEASVLGARSCHAHRPHTSWQTRLPTACPKVTFPRAGGPTVTAVRTQRPRPVSVHTARQHGLPDTRGLNTARDLARSQTNPGLILGAGIREPGLDDDDNAAEPEAGTLSAGSAVCPGPQRPALTTQEEPHLSALSPSGPGQGRGLPGFGSPAPDYFARPNIRVKPAPPASVHIHRLT